MEIKKKLYSTPVMLEHGTLTAVTQTGTSIGDLDPDYNPVEQPPEFQHSGSQYGG
jgi:hypothetical protein